MWKRCRSTAKRYPRDNRLIVPKSPYRRHCLAPQLLGWGSRNADPKRRLITVNPKLSHPVRTVGNTVGSLSEVQREIIVGTLLGDGAMRCRTNALLEINHSVRQIDYVEWKYRQLIDLVVTPPKVRKGNGNRFACRFV